MHNIKITYSVPMPATFPRGRDSFYLPKIREMRVGGSFTIPANLRGNAYTWGKKAGFVLKTSCKKCNRHTVRVFRVA